MDNFKIQAKQVVRHIPSKYSKEMATKSVVVNTNNRCYCTLFTTTVRKGEMGDTPSSVKPTE